jgi:hypothetical protein
MDQKRQSDKSALTSSENLPFLLDTCWNLSGGKSTVSRTPEGLERSRKANWKHGLYSKETMVGLAGFGPSKVPDLRTKRLKEAALFGLIRSI